MQNALMPIMIENLKYFLVNYYFNYNIIKLLKTEQVTFLLIYGLYH